MDIVGASCEVVRSPYSQFFLVSLRQQRSNLPLPPRFDLWQRQAVTVRIGATGYSIKASSLPDFTAALNRAWSRSAKSE